MTRTVGEYCSRNQDSVLKAFAVSGTKILGILVDLPFPCEAKEDVSRDQCEAYCLLDTACQACSSHCTLARATLFTCCQWNAIPVCGEEKAYYPYYLLAGRTGLSKKSTGTLKCTTTLVATADCSCILYCWQCFGSLPALVCTLKLGPAAPCLRPVGS